MTNHPNEDELIEGMADLSLLSKDELIAALKRSKMKCLELEDEVQVLDDENRDYKAALDESEKENEVLKEENGDLKGEVEMLKECLETVETATGKEVKEREDAMEIDEVEGKGEELEVCKDWAKRGRCRYGFEGGSCDDGYHPPKEDSKLAEVAEAEEEKAFV